MTRVAGVEQGTVVKMLCDDAPSVEPRDCHGEDRDRIAEGRDQRAEAHDEASEARDSRADARDARAEAREDSAGTADAGAIADRAGALRDRRGGASDRVQAADDRDASSMDRALSARERRTSCLDELTGAHRRDAGMVELEREMARAKRLKQAFTLAFVDVDDLKNTNDSLGHVAGDRLLRQATDSIRRRLRSYDLIIRYGGDEFLCVLADMTMAQAAQRFSLVNAELTESQQTSVSVGLAELSADDDCEDLIARADKAMYSTRKRSRSPLA